MFNSSKIEAFFRGILLLQKYSDFQTFVFNEDVQDVTNVHGKYWELQNQTIINSNDSIIVGVPTRNTKINEFQYILWQTACESIGIQYNEHTVEFENFFQFFRSKEFDVLLMSYKVATYELYLKPFFTTEYAIFYKAGEFHVSSTYFMDGLNTELWIYTWSTVVLIFIGFYISAKMYQRYFQVHSTIVDVAFYQMNFISNQIVKSPYERFKAWRIQTIFAWFFKTVMMTAVFTFIIALLSVKTTTEPFHSLEDFARIQTHTICLPPDVIVQKYFHDKFDNVFQQYKDIYNAENCFRIFGTVEHICSSKNYAIVWPVHQIPESRMKCRLLKLSGTFPKQYGSIMIQNNFKYREQFNIMYLRMQSAGIVKKAYEKLLNNHLKKKYDAKDHYNVELEGVLFEHVRLIFIGYSLVFPFVLIVLAIEILFKRMTLRMANKVEPTIEQRLEVFDPVVASTEQQSNEELHVIDLE